MFGLTPRSLGLVIAALLFLSPVLSVLASPDSPELLRRLDGEHVILADCRDGNGVVSSQMAYYNTTPGGKPNDVSIVHTNAGEAALWINRVTEGLFTDTGVTFSATLGPKVADGAFAGTGQNGYANFTCWQRYFKDLYVYDGTTCSQVYDCDHEPAPAVLPTPIGGNETAAQPSSPPQAETGMSQGAIIGIAVGAAGAVLLAASIALFYWYWRRAQRNEQPPDYSKGNRLCCGLFGRKEFIQPPGSPEQTLKDASSPYPREEAKGTPIAYEMDANWQRAEMGDGHGRVEIDTEHKAEIDSRPVLLPNPVPQEMDSPSPLSAESHFPAIHETVVSPQQPDTPQLDVDKRPL